MSNLIPTDTSHIPREVWILILTHLRKPLPAPLSRPSSRSVFSQHDLTSLCRVSKLFNAVATPILYRIISTDRFPSLLNNIDLTSPSSPLHFTEKLYVDYRDKKAEIEYAEILWAGEAAEPSQNPANECAELLQRVLAGSTISHLCVRNFSGPLCLPNPSNPDLNIGQRYLRVVHFRSRPDPLIVSRFRPTVSDAFYHEIIPLSTGVPTRFVSDLKGSECFALAIAGATISLDRMAKARAPRRTAGKRSEAVDLTVYCSGEEWTVSNHSHMLSDAILASAGLPPPSTSSGAQLYTLTAKQQRIVGEAQGEYLQMGLRAIGGEHDVIKWRPHHETPVCQACGSGQA
ncbi:uncharacterized protein MKK02DRAFT_39647 [Dioszegia hungarica]|uniref:F-box domain-containing protein n=1 Tax=Dioszegia hungarica TaxID=4972 RepID=A0AA38HDT6_9TREE|nr:uncharacterized protein MKK02DRAFT_39647 [Dioszegia hungarica]KAI9639347.1 hypothetical protein MKK02DRAFT_39647 [Dioszegia hungarica]